MVFSSIIFLFYFLPVFLLVYYVIPVKVKNLWLLIAGMVFYIWGAPTYAPILLLSCFFDFYSSLQFKKTNKKIWFITALTHNILLLLYFKYANFFIDNFNQISSTKLSWQKVVLPIGISFLTFQKISYLVDVYRNDKQSEPSPTNYLLFITLFPHAIAGPIVRYKEICEQLTQRFTNITAWLVYNGLVRFVIGLSKKVLLANIIGQQADIIFNNNNPITFISAWMGIICYTLQIYLDFSGYTDMAIGLAKMMGFTIPENFNFPYTAKSITDFWKRWHITLSNWMKDYLYIPLGGNKAGKLKTYTNLFIVFLISGFWHGASYNFIVWGMIHGFFMVMERLFLQRVLLKTGILQHAYTLFVVMLAWVFFRSDDLESSVKFIAILLNPTSININYLHSLPTHLVFALTISIVFAWLPNSIQIKTNKLLLNLPSNTMLIYLTTLASLLLYALCLGEIFASGFNPFIYFKF